MNEMRKLMETIEKINEADYIPNREYEPGENSVHMYGPVKAEFTYDEVLLTHGHGQNIFLSMKEWEEFAGEIQDIFV